MEHFSNFTKSFVFCVFSVIHVFFKYLWLPTSSPSIVPDAGGRAVCTTEPLPSQKGTLPGGQQVDKGRNTCWMVISTGLGRGGDTTEGLVKEGLSEVV